MNSPNNIALPFFAYGVFKPHELSYYRIKDYVKVSIQETVDGRLTERDGVPLLVQDGNVGVEGFLLYFRSENAKIAYASIAKLEPDKIYKWGIVTINNEEQANALIGKNESKGSTELEHVHKWEGKDDPLFKFGVQEVETMLERDRDSSAFDYNALFRLQMAYAFLWTIIERYTALKYSLKENPNKRIEHIAEEKCFIDSLKRNTKRKDKVFSTNEINKSTLDPSNPRKSINYYYQIRSNIVHRGKCVWKDYERLLLSLEELLFIFKDILDATFTNK